MGTITLGNYIINFMAIGLALSLGIILSLIWVKGTVPVNEPRRCILAIELFLMVAIIGLAIYNLVGWCAGTFLF